MQSAPIHRLASPSRFISDAVRTGGRWSLLLAAGLAWTAVQVAAQEIVWTPLADGLEAGVWRPGAHCGDEVPELAMVKIDPERFRFAIYHYLDERLETPLTMKEWQQRTGSVVLLNAGLFREDYSYMGLLFKNGRSLGTKRHPLWQGLFVAEPRLTGLRKARVLDLAVDAFAEDAPAYREAAQSLMLLDRTGKPRVRQSGKRAHQTLIGEGRDGHIVFMKTTEPAGLYELAECLRRGIASIYQVMAMDGGASSDLLITAHIPLSEMVEMPSASTQALQAFVDGNGMRHIPLPSVIGVLPRSGERGKVVEGYWRK